MTVVFCAQLGVDYYYYHRCTMRRIPSPYTGRVPECFRVVSVYGARACAGFTNIARGRASRNRPAREYGSGQVRRKKRTKKK